MTPSVEVSRFLNQIFYKNNKFDNADDLVKLEGWMFTREKMEEWNNVVNIPIQKEPVKRSRNFSPTKQDTLFWCLYTAHHGESAYWIIENKYKNAEIEEKHAMIEYIKANSSKIRGTSPKISQVKLQEIMSNLMMNKTTDWITFHVMCMFYNIHVIVMFEKTFLDFTNSLQDESTPLFTFDRLQNGHISINYNCEVETIRSSFVKLEYMNERPIKTITNYKLPELLDMAEKLGIKESALVVKPKKIDWYNAILTKCTW